MNQTTCQCPQCRAGQVYRLNESHEMELAMELLNVSSEQEMDQFLGGFFKKAWSDIKKISKPLGGVLKAVAKKSLPFVGGALGSFIPIPGVGTAIGSAVGGALSNALEMEYGELDEAEQELEMARAFVRFANNAVQQAAHASAGQHPQAVLQGALKHALALQQGQRGGMALGRAAAGGRWQRKGNTIELTL
jgi:hypothetical protein